MSGEHNPLHTENSMVVPPKGFVEVSLTAWTLLNTEKCMYAYQGKIMSPIQLRALLDAKGVRDYELRFFAPMAHA